jgi:hypothetical protein
MSIGIQRKIFLIFFIVAGMIVFLYGQKNIISAQFYKWKLIPQSENFTELFFDKHYRIPKTVVAQDTVPFSFVVHNVEERTMDYVYEVYAVSEEGQQMMLDQGNVTVANDEYKTIDETYRVPKTIRQTTIFIELPELKQKIHFLLIAQ